MARFQALTAWQETHEMALAVYRLTLALPPGEKFGLCSQMRRAAVSAAANIAEGRERETDGDFGHFLSMAAGSIAEVQYYLILGRDLHYFTEEQIASVADLAAQALALVNGLRRALKTAARKLPSS